MKRLLAVVAVALVATACSSVVPAAPAPVLRGTSWIVREIGGEPLVSSEAQGGKPTLGFGDGDQVSGSGGCNRFAGSYTLDGTAISFGPFAVTAMACLDADVGDQEQRYLAALGKATTFTTDGLSLALLDGSGTVLVDFRQAPAVDPVELLGTTWTLDGIIDGETVTSTVSGTTVTVVFSLDSVSGKACNTFGGSATIDGDSLQVGPLHSTRMACPSQEETAQETAVLDVLGRATTIRQDGSSLTISADDGSGLQFVAE